MNVDKGKIAAAKQSLREFLARTHRRNTPERDMILEVAYTLKGHFSPDDVCDALAEASRHIAPATVYSTVALLAQGGLLQKHRFGRRTLYEAASQTHSHTVCTSCGNVRDLRLPVLEQQVRTMRLTRFTPEQASVTIYGLCSACQRKSKLDKRKKVNSKK